MAKRLPRAITLLLVVSLLAAASAGAATLWAVGLAGGSHGESQSATLQLTSTMPDPGSICNSSAFGATACATGFPVAAGPLSSSTQISVTGTLKSSGSADASAAMVASAACGVAELADTGSDSSWSGSGSNTALPLGGLTYQAPGPLSGKAITTDGTTGWAETTGEYTNPETFTILAWFKTSSASGSIIGFSNNQTAPASATNDDRMLWIDPTGHVVWGVFNNAPDEVTSSSTYADGAWHFVAASIGSAGQQLYLDGALAGSSGNTGAQSYSGWWSIGYSFAHNAGWPDDPSSAFFNGSLAQIAIIPSQLNSTQITNLNADNTLPTYTAAVNALSPVNDWQLGDSGSAPYEGSVPGDSASTTLADASGNANTATAEGGATLGASGPSALGSASAISLNGSTGWAQTTTSYANPEGFSIVAWFKTSSASGGTIIQFTNLQGNGTPTTWDRQIWIDNAGKLVWGLNPTGSSPQEVTSTNAYNDGQWHMVVAQIGSSGQQLYVDGTLVASNSAVTAAQSYTGYWHLGWGDETSWGDPPTNSYLTGSLSETAVIPTQLTLAQIGTLYNAGSTAAYTLDVGALSPTAYWPLLDSASNVCGTTEITIRQTVLGIKNCMYPANLPPNNCPAASSSALITGLGVRSIPAPTSSNGGVTIKIYLELSAASPAGVLGLHELADISFGTTLSTTLWTAQLAYPFATSQL
jgi:hypothetical protein